MYRSFKPNKVKGVFNFYKQFSYINFNRNFLSSYIQNGSVYIHWPYCRRRCSYCDFVKFVPKEGSSWTFSDTTIEDALVFELDHILKNSFLKQINSVFFGGGTPSLARPQLVERILNCICKYCSVSSHMEVTMEANPTSLEMEKLKDFCSSGVNRLSLGVQSFNTKLLSLMNRDHSAKEALACIEQANVIYPHHVNVDIIFALPDQTMDIMMNDLETALNLGIDHMSLYELTLENGTELFKQVKKGKVSPLSEDAVADLWFAARHLLSDNGFRQYEVSNFARGSEFESIHNKAVWQGGQYVGVGPGAHSRVITHRQQSASWLSDGCREARINAPDPASWLSDVHRLETEGKDCLSSARKSTSQLSLDVQMEYLSSSLRTAEGAVSNRWNLFSPLALYDVIESTNMVSAYGQWLPADGVERGRFALTDRGLDILDSFLPRIFATLQKQLRHKKEDCHKS